MSWGERSCKPPCRMVKKYYQPNTTKEVVDLCTVDCPGYEWDGKTKPDSVSSKNEIIIGRKEEAKIEGETLMKELEKKEYEYLKNTHPGCVFIGDHSPRQVTKISRNSPCPCGSGKKYKRCCINK